MRRLKMANFIGLVYATLKNEGIDTKGMPTDEAVAKYNELQKKSGGKSGEKEPTPAEKKKLENMGLGNSHKEQQLDIIKKYNPMRDDYHVGIRNINDIKTFEEAMKDDESFYWGDFEREDAEQALKDGVITVYSSKPIEQGAFVSTSKNQAKDYAGGGQIYSKIVPIDDVAWINGDEGQFAEISKK